MRPIRAITLYFVLVFAGGALIAPWLYGLVQTAAAVFPALEPLASKPFPRFVNRSLFLLALAGLYPFIRAAGLGSWQSLGLAPRPRAAAHIAWGFVFGVVSLTCMAMIVLAVGARHVHWEREPTAILARLFKAALTAAAVAPLEEIVFRGVLFGAFRRSLHWVAALVLSSALFALLHFLERGGPVSHIEWNSGFVVLGGMLSGVRDIGRLTPGLLNLFLVGAILALAYHRSGSLYFPIGLHAGWIVWLKTYAFVTRAAAESTAPGFFGTGKLVNGWLAFVVLALVLVMMSRFMARDDAPRFETREVVGYD